ncbi:MAG: 50S ribosomal protein L13 [Syntrophales bacterium]
MKTYQTKAGEVARNWYVVDADGKVLGRLACEVARRLRGKHKPVYAPDMDAGDFVIVLNAGKMILTGKKMSEKIYYRHSGYPGGIKMTVAGDLLKNRPEELLRMAVRGMLPKNTMGRSMLRKLKVYSTGEHPHEAQDPQLLTL